jgi:hypothetical protein
LRSLYHLRESSDNPILNAFCRVAPSERFNFLAIRPAGVFFFAIVFSSRTCVDVHARLFFVFLCLEAHPFVICCSSLFHGRRDLRPARIVVFQTISRGQEERKTCDANYDQNKRTYWLLSSDDPIRDYGRSDTNKGVGVILIKAIKIFNGTLKDNERILLLQATKIKLAPLHPH